MASSVASTASPAPSPSEGKVLKGRDLINIGIFTAIYFVIQFVFMLCGGIHPALWVFMPALDGLFAGIPFMLMCAKVQKPGAVVIMGLIVALIYFATGMFTPLILAMMAASCVVAEVIRAVARYRSGVRGVRPGHVRKPPAAVGVPRLVRLPDRRAGYGRRLPGVA